MNKMPWLRRVTFFILSIALIVSEAHAVVLERGPYLQIGTPDSMTVRWRTDVATSSSVQYGVVQGNLTSTFTDATLTTEHSVTLTGLDADQRYYYALMDGSNNILTGNDASHFFITSPQLGMSNSTRVWVIGDSGTGNANAAAVYNAYQNYTGPQYTDLWIMLGDNAYNDGTDTEYQSAVFDLYTDLLK